MKVNANAAYSSDFILSTPHIDVLARQWISLQEVCRRRNWVICWRFESKQIALWRIPFYSQVTHWHFDWSSTTSGHNPAFSIPTCYLSSPSLLRAFCTWFLSNYGMKHFIQKFAENCVGLSSWIQQICRIVGGIDFLRSVFESVGTPGTYEQQRLIVQGHQLFRRQENFILVDRCRFCCQPFTVWFCFGVCYKTAKTD